ncbi:hypothetical protein UFOVP1138_6 [uncultured Caudovirales phage]|uniref:Uncharacterized protein n=1 Tax=uncultured Caudovirales phage TaxID=2100421 RepID=A0A6J5QYF3_9CAUD|nr:hypothetical protein UFOVP975_25 [uncultured Caudovirales phage]CAB4186108.1 hypothetical protein UFOVP1138_6 [uncultured Caudovirales phage]CAB4204379.1 hypothetical protein UFOVP1394_3 [uncultured Caudovirales phage]
MSDNKATEKCLMSVYIDKIIVEKVKAEAIRQHRKISGQTEMMLAEALSRQGDEFDSKGIPLSRD